MEIKMWPHVIDSTAWSKLSKAMQLESTILNTRTSPENLEKLYLNGLTVVMVSNDSIIGHISAWPVEEGYLEIGSAWVHPMMRGQGLGRELYHAINGLAVLNGNDCFAVTMNPIALKAGMHAGLHPHKDWNHPIPYRLTCGPCDLLVDSDKPNCPMRNNTCWLRTRR